LVNKKVDVIVNENSFQSSILQEFLYDSVHTPMITAIFPNRLSVLGNELITITGVDLPSIYSNILIGNQQVTLISATNSTQLIIQSPALSPGLYDLLLFIDSIGNVK